jgi:hypothetical protein
MLLARPNASSSVWLADLMLSSLGTGNDGATYLDWGAGPASGIWDVTIMVYYR